MKLSKWLPYILLAPSLLYLAVFFLYPMVQSFQLAFTREGQFLNLRAEPSLEAAATGTVDLQSILNVIDRTETEETLPNRQTRPIFWFNIQATNEAGSTLHGWVNQRNVFIENRRTSDTVRVTSGESVRGWTFSHIQRMFQDFRFGNALVITLLLIILILPFQFGLAILMALVLQNQLRGNSIFLYIYAIPLGISDLAAGILWFSIFTQRGFINSLLVSLGVLERPFIVIAEIWRATSIVMVIVVSGLQAIPRDYLEAGEIFGASLWQRLRYIILQLLKPSLQVALILRTILAFQMFAVVIAITGGDILTVLANETYRWYDPAQFNNPNVAAVYAGFILIISLGVSLFCLRAVQSQEERTKTL